jgi:hypothetical protein
VRAAISIMSALALAGCGYSVKPYTLYRNSGASVSLERPVRIHVATFDASESDPAFNRDNCAMSSRLYNANIVALTPLSPSNPVQRVGFWCEAGPYRENGEVPAAFNAAFPTDTE